MAILKGTGCIEMRTTYVKNETPELVQITYKDRQIGEPR